MSILRKRVAVLVSGRGSNLTALMAAARDPAYPAEIALVLSNRADAAGLARARAEGIATAVVESRQFKNDRPGFEAAMQVEFARHGIELIALAGFMRILTEDFVLGWQDRMINIHPSLLPLFKGLDTHARALEAGVTLHGCTSHLVRPGVDEGPILIQAAVPVLPGDTEDSLGARVLAEEHRIYPAALAWLAAGRIRVAGNRAVVEGVRGADAVLLNPLPSATSLPKPEAGN